jgi:hypothetical protein
VLALGGHEQGAAQQLLVHAVAQPVHPAHARGLRLAWARRRCW